MLDTTVLLAGIIWPRWPYEVLQHALRGDFQLIFSPVGIAEATRKFHSTRFHRHSRLFEQFLDECNYEKVPTPTLEQVQSHRNLMRDINDVPLALSAILAQVDCFVSEDKDFTAKTEQNLQLHRQLRVLLPGTFLREVMGWSSEGLENIRGRNWEDIN
jgi:predicted nucleic acid-binding protein